MEVLKELVVGEYTIEQKALNSLKSAVFMPDRISFNSKDDTNILNNNGFYNQFTVNLRNPILSAKTMDLMKTTIPIITTNIPDSETTFWYYRIPPVSYISGNPVPDIKKSVYLYCIRLQDSAYFRETITSNYPINRYYNSYSDLLTDLNLACNNDVNNPYFARGDISFALDLSSNKFSFTGSNPLHLSSGSLTGYYYLPADVNDPNVITAQKNLATLNFGTAYAGYYGFPNQSYITGRTLNTRLGFVNNYNGLSDSSIQYINQLRPIYEYPSVSGTWLLLYSGGTQTAQSYANLVYSQNVNVYCTITAGSAYSSENGGAGNFLLAVPLNTTPLGVSYYTNTQRYPLKIPSEIYALTFIFKTDTGLPFYFPVSENISIETGFTY